ncbi:DUF3306 domain-containing protein [Ruegeria sp. HKCCD7559]|uniref:DUF3306 domain-containing protein n=1 Tax=Ruegeria sp. HKCCD7559 TaxID=2683005 RepID=UPI001492AEDC|nr:DUF3306 domain-containing protein [Ruegeria sp. HKCCD7559]NOC44965.1 DUF3306 domain-containing protein [Ruegeria sp. HKCCD7559]
MNRPDDFWSRRKAAVQAEAKAEALALEEQVIAERQAELEEKDDAEILAEFNLPDPETLQPGDDVSGFMAKAVPDRLRRRALRRLWRLNPVLANVDGLVDYGEDYTDAACVIENMQTAYQVGKGMLAHIEALAIDAEEAKDDAAESEADTRAEPEAAPVEPDTEPEPVSVARADEPEEIDLPPAPRRMTFEFEG